MERQAAQVKDLTGTLLGSHAIVFSNLSYGVLPRRGEATCMTDNSRIGMTMLMLRQVVMATLFRLGYRMSNLVQTVSFLTPLEEE